MSSGGSVASVSMRASFQSISKSGPAGGGQAKAMTSQNRLSSIGASSASLALRADRRGLVPGAVALRLGRAIPALPAGALPPERQRVVVDDLPDDVLAVAAAAHLE